MLFMIELHYTPEHRDAALGYFLDHGSTHYEGKVTLENGWVATRDGVAYVLVRTGHADEVDKACEPLRSFGEIYYHQVTSTDEI